MSAIVIYPHSNGEKFFLFRPLMLGCRSDFSNWNVIKILLVSHPQMNRDRLLSVAAEELVSWMNFFTILTSLALSAMEKGSQVSRTHTPRAGSHDIQAESPSQDLISVHRALPIKLLCSSHHDLSWRKNRRTKVSKWNCMYIQTLGNKLQT